MRQCDVRFQDMTIHKKNNIYLKYAIIFLSNYKCAICEILNLF